MAINYDNIKVIAFDADDTLWVNETFFRAVEEQFSELLVNYETKKQNTPRSFTKKEIENLQHTMDTV